VPAARHPARVIAQPVVTKVAVSARLCTDRGILNAVAARRQKAAYQRLKRIAWGDAIFDADHDQAE
jgi:ribosomal protein RSM22 (predicted rRNA methylase)